MRTRRSKSVAIPRTGMAFLAVLLLIGACGEGGDGGSPTAPPLPPPGPEATRIAGSMIDPRGGARIGGASFEYTNPDGTAGQFSGATFSFDIKPGTSVAVSAADYESRTIGPTPDTDTDSYFMRFTGDARFNERFQDVALSIANSTQRLSGNCLRGEAPTPLEVQVDAPSGFRGTIRDALADLEVFTRGAYTLSSAELGPVKNWTPEPGVLKIVFTSLFSLPCYPAFACTNLVGDPPQILGASILIASDRSTGGSYFRILLSQRLAFVAGAQGFSDTGGVMTSSTTKFIDKYDEWTFNTLYCLPIGYSPGSLTTAPSAGTALPFQLDPTAAGSLAGPAGPAARPTAPGAHPSVERRRPSGR